MKQNFTKLPFRCYGNFALWKVLFMLLITNSYGQTVVFDDFSYNGNSDPAIASFNKWEIVNNIDGPIYPANYSKNNVTFSNDPNNSSNKIMSIVSSTTNNKSDIVNGRIQTSDYSYFEGTYAARVYFDDSPSLNHDGANQTFYSIVDYTLGPDKSKYSEIDFEYLAYDVWGDVNNKDMWMTSYNSYTDTELRKASINSAKSYAGWHTLVYSFTDKVRVKFWIDGVFIGQVSVAEDGSGLTVYPRSPMQMAFANWIWYEGSSGLGSSTARRNYTMQVDWCLFYQGAEKSLAEVNQLVTDYRNQGIQRRNLAGNVYQVVTNKAPQVSITSPLNGTSYATPANINISASASDADGSVTKVEFYNGGQLLGTATSAPYTYSWTNVSSGSYSITAKAYDNSGASATSSAVSVTVNQVQQTGVVTLYKHCNYSIAGYGISLPIGNYTLSQLIALGIQNDDISSVKVQAGYQVVLYADDNFTGSSLTVKSDNSCLVNNGFNDIATSVKVSAIVNDFSILIQAEDYTNMSGVQTESTTDVGNGLDVGWIDTGDWLVYANINFPSSGTYIVEYRVASLYGGGNMSCDLNAGSIQLGAIDVPSTGGWQNWTTISQTVTINAGTYNFGIYSQSGGWNLNWLRISKQGTAKLTQPNIATGDVYAVKLELYPNPAVNQLNLKSETDLSGVSLRIVNASGMEVLKTVSSGNVVDIYSLTTGIYTIIINKDGEVLTRRFIKN